MNATKNTTPEQANVNETEATHVAQEAQQVADVSQGGAPTADVAEQAQVAAQVATDLAQKQGEKVLKTHQIGSEETTINLPAAKVHSIRGRQTLIRSDFGEPY